ncbi:hypothetical protein [Tengunoibacter tsumagoiensis]|uniref:NfeD-like C-terminal domain-containing protein n=1 Tax=Tengunoibacter tsumagoiensis TaxID=2014871 RepID=A0A402A2U6_9CHLR|nr:hypothetical protein [Tengunoibacter tsumagoiensis]GCE13392.1 hypothetical protein KTT_32510 [Tengunoibacter tsumagoiensis]
MIATDPLSILFIVCFLLGILFLVITSLLGGGHGHTAGIGHGHAAPHVHLPAHAAHVSTHATHAHTTTHTSHQSTQRQATSDTLSFLAYINPITIVLFAFGFGFFGYIFHNATTLPLAITLLLASISGLLVAALIVLLISRIFRDSEGATVQDVSDRTGLLGKVSLTIQEHGMGEILYLSPGGMRKSIPARSIDGRRLERDQEVVVINYQRGIAEVDTWEHFVNQEESVGIEGSHSNELATLRALLDESTNITEEYALQQDQQKE